jgi:hypothetical protein
MAQQKTNAPPPAYGSDIASPQPAHVTPFSQSQQGSEHYGASPYGSPHPGAQGIGYPPPQQNFNNSNGYYSPGPQMGYQQQQPQYGTSKYLGVDSEKLLKYEGYVSLHTVDL